MLPINVPGVIDMSGIVNAVKQKYGAEYYRSDEAKNELAATLGCIPNNSGVLPEERREQIVNIGGCKGEISFAQTSKGCMTGISASTSIGGFSYAPSIWSNFCFATYDDARLAGVQRLIQFFESAASDHSGNTSSKTLNDAKSAISALQSEKTPQLSLF